MKSTLTLDESETVSGKNLVDGLEVSHTAALAVTRATGGDTLGLGTRVERTARVTGLGADIGLGEASDTALGVAHGRTNGADGVAVDTGGGAGWVVPLYLKLSAADTVRHHGGQLPDDDRLG